MLCRTDFIYEDYKTIKRWQTVLFLSTLRKAARTLLTFHNKSPGDIYTCYQRGLKFTLKGNSIKCVIVASAPESVSAGFQCDFQVNGPPLLPVPCPSLSLCCRVSSLPPPLSLQMSHNAVGAFCRSVKLQCELYPSREVAICLDPYCGLGFVLWCLCRSVRLVSSAH